MTRTGLTTASRAARNDDELLLRYSAAQERPVNNKIGRRRPLKAAPATSTLFCHFEARLQSHLQGRPNQITVLAISKITSPWAAASSSYAIA